MRQKKMSAVLAAGALLAGGILWGSQAQAEGASAEMLSNTCAGCHGTNGVAAGPAMPSIGGLDKTYLKTILDQYKSGERPSTIMKRIVDGYTDAELAQISEFFAKQKWGSAGESHAPTATKVDKALAKKGKDAAKKCEKCHEDGGRTQEEGIPRVAGQWVDYLLLMNAEYKRLGDGIPMDKKMRQAIEKMSDDELKAIAHYYASEK